MKTIKLLFTAILIATAFTGYAQDPSAAFQVDATDQGFLMPRVADTTSVSTPATGLQVYDTGDNVVYTYNGTNWVASGGASGKFVDGTTATDAVYTAGNVAVGTSAHKNALLHVSDAKGDTYFPTFDANGLVVKISGETLNNNILSSGNSTAVGIRTSGDDVYTGSVITSAVISAEAATDRTSSLARLFALDIASINRSDANMDNVWGANSSILNIGAGTVTNAISMRLEGANLGAGSISNYYGLYIADASSTADNTNYAIYSLGGDSYHEGSIGVGIEVPTGKLHLNSDSPTVSNMFKMTTDGGGGFYSGASDSSANPNWVLGSNSAESIEIRPGGFTNTIFANGVNGRVGIGTETPSVKLEVTGMIKIGSSSITPQAGMMRYNSTNDRFEGYVNDDGSGSPGWVALH